MTRIDTHQHVVPPEYAAWLGRSGTLERCPDVKIVLSHAGGFVPFAASRLATFASPRGDVFEGFANLQRFWFDIALSGSPSALPSLLAFADPTRITFGTDWPYAPSVAVAAMTQLYERYELADTTRQNIDRSNAEVLFPRLAATEAATATETATATDGRPR